MCMHLDLSLAGAGDNCIAVLRILAPPHSSVVQLQLQGILLGIRLLVAIYVRGRTGWGGDEDQYGLYKFSLHTVCYRRK